MDKCWFVLQQTHYPPPTTEYIDGGKTKQSGAICLGDMITSLDALDYRLNENGPEPLPLDMPIYRTSSGNFKWELGKTRDRELRVLLTAPMAALLGVDIGAELETILRKSTTKSYLIEALECEIIQPRRAYIDSALAIGHVRSLVNKKTNLFGWKLYMVTGMIIAKGRKSQEIVDSREISLSGGPDVQLGGIQRGLPLWLMRRTG
ncbi:hypothetical protein GGR58DRAFT_505460 [Xylaria digitata]|nr:hypothetical protein GGR58DRAFT_505460 [Xylaria digitata]